MAKAAAAAAGLSRVLKRLHRPAYKVPPKVKEETALERLLALVLQGDGSALVARRAVKALGRYYAHWNEVRLARRYEIRDVLAERRISAPDQRAAAAQELLRRVFGLQNHLALDWLYDATSERRGRLLASLGDPAPHAGPVLDLDAALMDPELEVPPVTTDTKRLLARLGVAPANPKDARVREILVPSLQGAGLYPGFVALEIHAREVCASKHPRCRHCRLLDLCPFGKRSLSTASYAAALSEMGLDKPARKRRASGARRKTAGDGKTQRQKGSTTRKTAEQKGGARKHRKLAPLGGGDSRRKCIPGAGGTSSRRGGRAVPGRGARGGRRPDSAPGASWKARDACA